MQGPLVSKGAPNRPPVRLTPMPVPKASDVLADDLRERILLGEFPEGTALPTERDLVTQTQMSRATVREALRAQLALAFTTEDIVEGVAAFREKREAVWKMR